MAKETREERAVRSMIQPLTECMIELRALASGPCKESDVEVWCQTVMKSVLGFSASAGYQVRSQETRGKLRFDLVVSDANNPDKIQVVVEVKRLGSDLNKSDLRSGKTQLKEYLSAIGDVRWGVLTNGYEWRLYDFKSQAICIASVDIRDDQGQINATAKGVEESGWDLLDFSEYFFSSKTWEKLSVEAQAFSPESLARSILSANVVKYIARTLGGTHDYRISTDVLTDKLTDLVENGLDDLVGHWNETQRAELDRYVRNQKRAAKTSRKKGKTEPKGDTQPVPELAETGAPENTATPTDQAA